VHIADRVADSAGILREFNEQYSVSQHHFGISYRHYYDHHDLGIYKRREEVSFGNSRAAQKVKKFLML